MSKLERRAVILKWWMLIIWLGHMTSIAVSIWRREVWVSLVLCFPTFVSGSIFLHLRYWLKATRILSYEAKAKPKSQPGGEGQ